MSRIFISDSCQDNFEAIAFHDWLIASGRSAGGGLAMPPDRKPSRIEDLKHLAKAFCAARARRGLTQEALAEHVGVNFKTISNSERAESLVSLPVFLKLAAVLGLSSAEIVDVPAIRMHRKVTTKRRQLEGDLERSDEQVSDSNLDLLVRIGRLMRDCRGT